LEKKQIQNQIKNYQMAYDSASVELEKEILGKQSGLTSGKVGYGTNAKRKAELKEQKRADLKITKNKCNRDCNIWTRNFKSLFQFGNRKKIYGRC
jgi:hypothetical protein